VALLLQAAALMQVGHVSFEVYCSVEAGGVM